MAFNDNLIRIRELRGKKQTDVIAEAGVKKGQYYAWESGEYQPSTENLDLLSRYFQVPREIFFKDSIADSDVLGPKELNNAPNIEWFKRTIDTLIQTRGEYISQEVWALLKQDRDELNSARREHWEELKEVWNELKSVRAEKIQSNSRKS